MNHFTIAKKVNRFTIEWNAAGDQGFALTWRSQKTGCAQVAARAVIYREMPSSARDMCGRFVPLAMAAIAPILAACATQSSEQTAREDLMWRAAQDCKKQFGTIRSVDRIDNFGRIWFTAQGSGPENQAFLDCYHQRVQEKTEGRPLLASGRVAPSKPGLTQTTLPAEPRGQALVIRASLNRTLEAKLLVDTGATVTTVKSTVLQRLGVAVPINATRWPIRPVGGGEIRAPAVRIGSLTLGEFSVEDLDVLVVEALPVPTDVDGLLGANVLNHFRVTVDRGSRMLLLERSVLDSPK